MNANARWRGFDSNRNLSVSRRVEVSHTWLMRLQEIRGEAFSRSTFSFTFDEDSCDPSRGIRIISDNCNARIVAAICSRIPIAATSSTTSAPLRLRDDSGLSDAAVRYGSIPCRNHRSCNLFSSPHTAGHPPMKLDRFSFQNAGLPLRVAEGHEPRNVPLLVVDLR